jgi:heme exporter protein CcmD
MNMDTLTRLWLLDGHGPFVWGAYAPALLLLVAEALMVRTRLRRAREQARIGADQ